MPIRSAGFLASMKPTIYAFILRTDNASVDEALASALAEVEPTHAESIVRAITARGGAGAGGLIDYFHRLPTEARNLACDHLEQLREPIRTGMHSPEVQTRQNAAAVIAHAKAFDLADVLSIGLMDPAPEVHQAAASALRDLADDYLSRWQTGCEQPPEEDDSEEADPDGSSRGAARAKQRHMLVAAIQDGLNNFGLHKRLEVLEAAMWLAEQVGRVLQAHAQTGSKSYLQALIAIFQDNLGPRMAEFAYVALSWSRLRKPIAQVIEQQPDSPFVRELFKGAHHLDKPAVRRGLTEVGRLPWLEDDKSFLLNLPTELQAGAVRLVAATGINLTVKLMVLQDALLLGRRDLQRAALKLLIDVDNPQVTQVLREVLAWDDGEFSELILPELLRRNPPDLATIVVQQLGSRSASVRQMAAEHASSYSFQQYWQAFDSLDDAARLAAGRAVCKLVPDFAERLERILTTDRTDEIVRALRMAIELNFLKRLGPTIRWLADHRDAVVRGMAAQALDKMAAETPQDEQPDQTAEASDDTEPTSPDQEQAQAASRMAELEQMLLSQQVQVRTVAVRELLDTQILPATELLIDMLGDPDPSAKACALSLLTQTKQVQLMARVLHMARQESDEELRKHAQSLATELCEALQASMVTAKA